VDRPSRRRAGRYTTVKRKRRPRTRLAPRPRMKKSCGPENHAPTDEFSSTILKSMNGCPCCEMNGTPKEDRQQHGAQSRSPAIEPPSGLLRVDHRRFPLALTMEIRSRNCSSRAPRYFPPLRRRRPAVSALLNIERRLRFLGRCRRRIVAGSERSWRSPGSVSE